MHLNYSSFQYVWMAQESSHVTWRVILRDKLWILYGTWQELFCHSNPYPYSDICIIGKQSHFTWGLNQFHSLFFVELMLAELQVKVRGSYIALLLLYFQGQLRNNWGFLVDTDRPLCAFIEFCKPFCSPPSVPKMYILLLHGQMIKGARSGHTQTQRMIMRPRWASSTASEWP